MEHSYLSSVMYDVFTVIGRATGVACTIPASQEADIMLARFKWAIIFFILFLLIIPVQIVLVIQESQRSDGFTLESPGEMILDIKHAGDYTLWLQNQAAYGLSMKTYPMTLPSGLTLTLQRESDQSQVAINNGVMNKSVTVGSMQRQSIAAAQIPSPGQYRLIASGSTEPRLIYMSRDFLGRVILMSLCFGCTTAAFFFASAFFTIKAMTSRPRDPQPAIEEPL